jgi:ankyrin repeat protein
MSYGDYKIKWLLCHEIDINATNEIGETPLHSRQVETALTYARIYWITEYNDKCGDIPLQLAFRQGHISTGQLLMSFGANTNAANEFEQTPLHTIADEWNWIRC